MSEVTLDGLLRDCKLNNNDLDEKISGSDYPKISDYLREWRVLALTFPGFEQCTVDDIERDKKTQKEMRLEFLRILKQKHSIHATYRMLVNGLLDIGRAEDATGLCTILAGLLRFKF